MSGDPPKLSGRRSRRSPAEAAVVTLPPGAAADTRKDLIVEVIKATGLPPRQAAMSVGVSSSAFYRMAEDPAFVDAMDEATSVFARRMAAVIARAAGSLGSHKAAEWWLERRLPDAYGARLDLRVSDAPPERDLEEKLTDDARAARLAALVAEAQGRLTP